MCMTRIPRIGITTVFRFFTRRHEKLKYVGHKKAVELLKRFAEKVHEQGAWWEHKTPEQVLIEEIESECEYGSTLAETYVACAIACAIKAFRKSVGRTPTLEEIAKIVEEVCEKLGKEFHLSVPLEYWSGKYEVIGYVPKRGWYATVA